VEAGLSPAGNLSRVAQRRNFIAELGRRHVWRAAVLYAGAVWALSQGIAQLGPLFDAPNWAMRAFVIACVIGFPFWIAFAWFYEFTPQGLRRESEVAPNASMTHSTARKLDFAIIGVLTVAVALLASGYFVKRGGAPVTDATASTPFNPPADTLVVLPFANLGGDPKQQYFSDGITEELTNALGQNTGLRVIAWDTASKYRDSKQSAADIAKALDVANVLTGKILRQGNAVRVIVELVNARTGYQAWADHYDDSLSNIFQVQDKISAAIADALKVKFAAARTTRTVNPQAHDLVLRAIALMERARTAAPLEQARTLLEQAVALDPSYAEAHARLAHTWFELTQYSTLPLKHALPKSREEANKALALDPDNVSALIQLANLDSTEVELAKARAEYKRAIELDPSNALAHLDYGTVLPLKQALAETLEAVRLDPDDVTAQNNLAQNYLDLHQYAQALPHIQAMLRLDPHSPDNALMLAQVYGLLHQNNDAIKAFDLVMPDTQLGKALVAAGKLAYQSVLDPSLRAQALAAVEALRERPDLDPFSLADVIQLYLVLGENHTALNLLPGMCASIPVACNDLSLNPVWLPLHGDPGFEALVKKYDNSSQPPAPAATSAATQSSAP
jgi:TolB-like protein/Tfp pilus assembly protein PilF